MKFLKYFWFAINALGYGALWLSYVNPKKGDVRRSSRQWHRHVFAPLYNASLWFVILALLSASQGGLAKIRYLRVSSNGLRLKAAADVTGSVRKLHRNKAGALLCATAGLCFLARVLISPATRILPYKPD